MALKIKSFQASVSLMSNNARIVFTLEGDKTIDSGVIPVVNAGAVVTVLETSADAYLTVDAVGKPQFVTNAPDAPGP